MRRSLMQVCVKGSAEAVELYQKAFHAELKCAYPNDDGGYMHAELEAFGQIIAVSEIEDAVAAGNNIMFCFELGEGSEELIKNAYEVLKEGAVQHGTIGPCGYSSYQFVLVDKFGVYWCLFV